ncbi:MAG: cytochrome c3 family protein [Desulfobacterales bacterium]
MKNGKSSRTILFFGIAILSLITGIHVYGIEKFSEPPESGRADLIRIESMARFGDLERPPVTFLHDRHTTALEKQAKDCSACHLTSENRMVLQFKHIGEDIGKKDLMNLYHEECIGCHKATEKLRFETGPVECGGCHTKQPINSSRQPMQFDKSLHYRHSMAQDNKCEKCHHEYNATTKKLFYKKGNEGSCRYCHLSRAHENREAMSSVSHLSCIDCHQKTVQRNKKSGPVTCRGCHDLKYQKKIERVVEVPRIDRNQPDAVFVKNEDVKESGRMDRVPFDHKAHEKYSDRCIDCHHKNLSTCNSCHILKGKEEGDWVKLFQAMHQPDSNRSCMGCHVTRQEVKECRGCHGFLEKSRRQDDQSCQQCHRELIREDQDAVASEAGQTIALKILSERSSIRETVSREDIPEKIVLNKQSDTYKAFEMPHRKIVFSLMEKIKNNNLAAFFHREKGTICKGCHHNSPVSLKPPKCGSCHGKPFDDKDKFRPGLKGAYHIQCMECHQNMEIEGLGGCTDCHEEKKI